MTRLTAATPLILALAATGCGGSSGDDEDDGPEPVDPTTVLVNRLGEGGPLPLSKVKFWGYQIQNHYANPQELADSRYDMLVVDQTRSISDLTDYNDALLVSKLRSSANHSGGNKIVLAYIDIGEAEDYRWYWQPGWGVGTPSFIIAPDPDGWSGNYPTKFWDPQWKAVVFDYVDRIQADGYDGIYMDWLEAYDFDPIAALAVREGRDAKLEMVRFVQEISARAKAKNPKFLVIGQNAAELGTQAGYLASIDAQAQEDVWFGGETEVAAGDIPTPATGPWSTRSYQDALAVFLAARKPVFTCDYATTPANVAKCYSEAARLGYVEYVTTVELDKPTSTPPPGY